MNKVFYIFPLLLLSSSVGAMHSKENVPKNKFGYWRILKNKNPVRKKHPTFVQKKKSNRVSTLLDQPNKRSFVIGKILKRLKEVNFVGKRTKVNLAGFGKVEAELFLFSKALIERIIRGKKKEVFVTGIKDKRWAGKGIVCGKAPYGENEACFKDKWFLESFLISELGVKHEYSSEDRRKFFGVACKIVREFFNTFSRSVKYKWKFGALPNFDNADVRYQIVGKIFKKLEQTYIYGKRFKINKADYCEVEIMMLVLASRRLESILCEVHPYWNDIKQFRDRNFFDDFCVSGVGVPNKYPEGYQKKLHGVIKKGVRCLFNVFPSYSDFYRVGAMRYLHRESCYEFMILSLSCCFQ